MFFELCFVKEIFKLDYFDIINIYYLFLIISFCLLILIINYILNCLVIYIRNW